MAQGLIAKHGITSQDSVTITGSATITGDVSASTYYGDGSNLEGILSDPFPYTGSAEISGSLLVDGNVGIGTDTPSEKLHVIGNMVLDGGSGNMFIGDSLTGNGITAGQNNVGIGASALRNALSTTQYALAIGSQASRFGNHNHGMSVGYGAGYNGSQSSAYVGSSAGKNAAGQRNVGIGYRAGGGNSDGVQALYGNVSIGYQAGAVLETSATAVGYLALTNLTTGTGNTAIGYQAGLALTTGNTNIHIGYEAGKASTANNNVYIGKGAGSQAITSTNNVVVGNESFLGNNGQTRNVVIGNQAVYESTSHNLYNNVIVGHQAGKKLSGVSNGNVIVGTFGASHQTGLEGATLLGYSVSYPSVGDFSTLIGSQAGGGDYTTSLGRGAGNASSQYSVFLGTSAGTNETGSNKLYIENSDSSTPLIYGEFDNDLVRINGTFETSGSTTISGSLTITGTIFGSVTDITPTNQTASLDCSLSNFFTLTLSSSADTLLTASNIQPGQSINLRITQPATSGSLSYGSEFKFPNGLPYEVSATSSVEDIVSFIAFDSNTLYGSSLKNFV